MTQITGIFLISAMLAVAAGWRLRQFQRLGRRLALCLWGLATVCSLCGGYSYWYHHRRHPDAISQQALFPGVTYTREIYALPRPNVVHIVNIDLDAPGIRLTVTPGNPDNGRQLQARTTSQFIEEFDTQVAINAGFFHPFYAKGPLWYYPHVGDPVDVYGLSMFEGEVYSPAKSGYQSLYISQDGAVSIGHPIGKPYYAVSGFSIFVKAGTIEHNFTGQYYEMHPSPRTAVALDKSGRYCMLFLVDGRQPNYSEGLSLPELAEIIIRYNGYTALNLDGGGSTTLAIEGADGKPHVLNSPIHGRVPPGRERPVANHLGVFASRKPGE